MKKKIMILLVSVLLAGGWYFWWANKTSNPWNAETIGDIPTPLGYKRVESCQGDYTSYLRSLPLKEKGAKVMLYTGGESRCQFLSAAVIDKEILSNSEQCADVTMHLRADYLWKRGRYSDICFTNVNGQRMRYRGGNSRSAFENYMKNVYGWCSTYSVYRETSQRDIKDVQPGDVLVYAARPGHSMGHAIIVVDVAKNSSGKIAIMCAEGNTPARDMHIIRDPFIIHNPWFILDGDEESIRVHVFHFNKDELRHY